MPSDSPPSSASDRATSARPARGQHTAWGTSNLQSGGRRLAPLSTNLDNTSLPQRSFSSVLTSSRPTATNPGPPQPYQTGPQNPFGRLRSSTPSGSPSIPEGSASLSQGGGGGGGSSGNRKNTFSPSLSQTSINSPTTASFDRSSVTSSVTTAGANSQSSVSKIVLAQIYLLLTSITEKEGKAKWEQQMAHIRKLIEAMDTENYHKYIRRLISGNAPSIFLNMNKNPENPANYRLLEEIIEKLPGNWQTAQDLAETIYTSTDTDIFKDFDLPTFADHFHLDPFSKIMLALETKMGPSEDLRTKVIDLGNNIIAATLPAMLQTVFESPVIYDSPDNANDPNQLTSPHNQTPQIFGEIIERLVELPYPSMPDISTIGSHIERGYALKNLDVPVEVANGLQMGDLLSTNKKNILIHKIRSEGGPEITRDINKARSFLAVIPNDLLSEEMIASALLYMICTRDYKQYSPTTFIKAILQIPSRRQISWQSVTHYFDQEHVRVDSDRFSCLFNALLQVSHEDEHFDIQALWGGRWHFGFTQLSFVRAFLSSTSDQVDISKIPRFRSSFDLEDFVDAPDTVKEMAAKLQSSPFRSLEAVRAVFSIMLESDQSLETPASYSFLHEVLTPNSAAFVCSGFHVPREWTPTQTIIMVQYIDPFIFKLTEGYQFVLYSAWKQDERFLATRMYHLHMDDPMQLPLLLDHALEHGWINDLLRMQTLFAFDLAALGHKREEVDLEAWADRRIAAHGFREFSDFLSRFMTIKADDELRMQTGRDQQPPQQVPPLTIPLAIKTVNALLEIFLLHASTDDEGLKLIRHCIPAYPRLINYNQGFDEVIDANGERANIIPKSIDQKMQETYGKMYRDELSEKGVLDLMRKYKNSRDPDDQDLFACMVHGLLDEYYMYDTYPLEALKKTAMIFGGIINYKLIAGVPLRAALGMILDAVREHPAGTPMYKFGVEALEQSLDRLHEWPNLCARLTQVPDLGDTAVLQKAQEVLDAHQNDPTQSGDGNVADVVDVNGFGDNSALQNGNGEEFLSAEAQNHKFRSLHVDPPSRAGFYEDPDEEVQDKVLFCLNNVSEQNLAAKLKDLKEVIEEKHYQWLAAYVVDQRAKVQPNFQPLYLDLLEMCGEKVLWTEVLRETYVSVIRMLNADSVMNSSTERTHLKNLGSWLGSLTLARNKPIKHKNIYFKDLLIEAYDTQRLLVVIPFTCKVLVHAKDSIVFQPPNPWLMDIIRLLIELYQFAELKLNLKFEIEVLCKEINIEHKTIVPSTAIRERPQIEDDFPTAMIPNGLEGFENMTLGSIDRGARNERISTAAITSSLENLEPRLKFPAMANNSIADPERVHQILLTAANKAINEIIAPVVERSVTIATISTAQLILKDFAMEPDENKVRNAARHMAKETAAGLALVTSKEPLRSSMSNSIRMMQDPEQPMPEGYIMMFVNDNLDIACGMVEQAAGEQAIPDIDKILEDSLEARRRHKAARPNEPYIDPMISRWSQFIPEPYRQNPGGLNKEQLAIYDGFGRPAVPALRNHTQSSSLDSSRQLTDALTDSYGAVPTLTTPAETPALPHHTPQVPQDTRSSLAAIQATALPSQASNVPLDSIQIEEKLQSALVELSRLSKESSDSHLRAFSPDSQIHKVLDQVLTLVVAYRNPEQVAIIMAARLSDTIQHLRSTLESEVFIGLLAELCKMSLTVNRSVHVYLQNLLNSDSTYTLSAPALVVLLDRGLIDYPRVDISLCKGITEYKDECLELLSGLMDQTIFSDNPIALRANFSSSLDATGQRLAADPNQELALHIVEKLEDSGSPEFLGNLPNDPGQTKQDQMDYVFQEWIGIYNHPGTVELTAAAFIKELHHKKIISNSEDSARFVRVCIDMCVENFERVIGLTSSLEDAFISVDALARLIILLIRYQGGHPDDPSNGAVKMSPEAYMKSMLSVLALVLNHHHVVDGEQFNQKIFFRLFSTILFESHAFNADLHREFLIDMAKTLLLLQPKNLPGFTFGWISLIAHRKFTPHILRMSDDKGWEMFAQLVLAMLTFVSEMLKPADITTVAKYIYQAVLRILLVLHHDFPEFLTENHFRFCNVIPAHCTQLRNLVLSAYPSSFPELPDPFTSGLKVDRLEEIRTAPRVAGDYITPLQRANAKDVIDDILHGNQVSDNSIAALSDAIYDPPSKETGVLFAPINVDIVFLNSLVLYICQSAVSGSKEKRGQTFTSDSPQAILLEKLVYQLTPEGRYFLLSAIANQLRFPNSHTHFYNYVILHLFNADQDNKAASEVQAQITRVLLERLIVHRPHPWGLIITLLELLKNPIYNFWELPFIKAAPEIERLFTALFHHINQNPRALGEDPLPPHGIAALGSELTSYQAYDVFVYLDLPRTPSNVATGNFMVDLELLAPKTNVLGANSSTTVIAHSRRPAILTYSSTVVDTATVLAQIPWYVLGWRKEAEILVVPMMEGVEFAKGWRNIPNSLRLELHSRERMQVYGAMVKVVARFSGLRHLMYHYRLLSFLAFTSIFWTISLTSTFIAYFTLAHFLTPPSQKLKKEEAAPFIKQEPEGEETESSQEIDPLSTENLSDSPRTFPTLRRQHPLRYSSASTSEAGAKREPSAQQSPLGEQAAAGEETLVSAPGVEADDESEGYEEIRGRSGGRTDSGLGTSLEEGEGSAEGLIKRRRGSRRGE
ncbi:MAG: hypothetical protein M1834_002441 [Cirrosporium novae-zelandiae]|nr:MAG: hypothetical protein M1834_002441 [Cirrosporium novae-zelandiae]